jgi:hypothetical protein
MAIGDLITAVDYNNIRTKILGILGPGAGKSGYNQTLQSLQVSLDSKITTLQWNQLRADIFSTLLHQTGAAPGIFTATTGSLIRFGTSFPVNQYDTLSESAITNRFAIGANQFAIETGGSTSRTTAWNSSVSTTVVVNFANAAEARYFFNSGGKLRFQSFRSGGSVSAQNTSWTNLLNAAGVREIAGETPSVNFYNLTNSYQNLYSTTASAPYSSNTYTIDVLCNEADNSSGTASQLTFRVTWTDPYVDPGNTGPNDFYPGDNPNTDDIIDGTLGLTVTQLRATGDLYNASGTAYATFTVAGPSSYSIPAISGS